MSCSLPMRHIARACACLGFLAMLGACVSAPPPTASASRFYLANLSQAKFALDTAPDSLAAAKPYLRKMNAYAEGKSGNAGAHAVDVLELQVETGDDHKKRRVLAPVTSRNGTYDFSLLKQAMRAIAAHRPEYQAINADTVTVPARPAIHLTRATSAAVVADKVKEWHNTIVSSAQPLPPMEAATLQLGAARYFMDAGVRDAAYLALNNAKTELAHVGPDDAEPQSVEKLSAQLTAFETALHKKLPYTF